jgi:hypothetical protein
VTASARARRVRTAALLAAIASALALPLTVAPAPARAQTGPAVARVAALEGTAAVERFGSRQQSPLAVEAPIYRADTIHTGAGSRLRIAFEDETAVTLGELASLHVTQIADPARGGSQSSRLTMLAGTARFRVRRAPSRALVETWTPTAVAAMRGTEYIVEVTAPGTAVLVIDGVVAVSNSRPDVRGTVVLRAGEGTSVAPDRPPQPPSRWGAARRRAVEDATRLP